MRYQHASGFSPINSMATILDFLFVFLAGHHFEEVRNLNRGKSFGVLQRVERIRAFVTGSDRKVIERLMPVRLNWKQMAERRMALDAGMSPDEVENLLPEDLSPDQMHIRFMAWNAGIPEKTILSGLPKDIPAHVMLGRMVALECGLNDDEILRRIFPDSLSPCETRKRIGLVLPWTKAA
jgi:hypothetical protein